MQNILRPGTLAGLAVGSAVSPYLYNEKKHGFSQICHEQRLSDLVCADGAYKLLEPPQDTPSVSRIHIAWDYGLASKKLREADHKFQEIWSYFPCVSCTDLRAVLPAASVAW